MVLEGFWGILLRLGKKGYWRYWKTRRKCPTSWQRTISHAK